MADFKMDMDARETAVVTDEVEDLCSSNKCLPTQFNADGDEVACESFIPANCLIDGPYSTFYNGVNWDTLKSTAEEFFKGFGNYCWDTFIKDEDYRNAFIKIFPQYQFTSTQNTYGMFSNLINLAGNNGKYCKDVNYAFTIPCGDKGKHLRIFHIALHSKKSKFLGETKLRSSTKGNCGYYDRPPAVMVGKDPGDGDIGGGDGSGPFHYKIDNVAHPMPANSANCQAKFNEEKAPFKQFNYNDVDLQFRSNDNPFQNTFFAESVVGEALMADVTILHNIIYNLFVAYFNRFMLPEIRIGVASLGASDGAKDDSRGGRYIKRKSRRRRKSRKTKKSRKPKGSRKLRRLRKTRRLRK